MDHIYERIVVVFLIEELTAPKLESSQQNPRFEGEESRKEINLKYHSRNR